MRKIRRLANTCAGLEPILKTVPVSRLARIEPFVPSNQQMATYATTAGHTMVIGPEGRPTFDALALGVLAKRYPKDALYPIVLDYRDVEKQLGTYCGVWNEAEGRWEGGPPLGRDGRIHSVFDHTPSTLRLASKGPNCFDAQTEVLTEQGWVAFPDLAEGTPIAQWEPTGAITFVTPTAYQRYRHTGAMVSLRNQHIDLRVTADHRCLLRNRKSRCLKVLPADAYPEDWQQLHGGVYAGGPGVDLSPAELRMLCAVQADGTWVGANVTWTFAKSRKIGRLLKACGEAGVSVRIRGKAADQVHITAYAGPTLTKLAGLLGRPRKVFGPWLLSMTRTQMDAFLAEIYHWDGCRTRQSMYSSSVQANAVWVQILHALSGHRAQLRVYMPPSGRPNWQVDVVRRDYSLTTNVERRTEAVDEDVYCVSVPSSYVLVRRGNSVSVTGQCQNIPKGMRDLFIPAAGERLLEADFKAIEAVLVGYFANSASMVRLAKLGIHDFLNSHILARDKKIARPADPAWSDADLKACFKELKARFPAERDVAKRIAHSSAYGTTPRHLHDIYPAEFPTIASAATLQAIYFDVFGEVRRWQQATVRQAHDTGYLVNPFGYIHRFWDVLRYERTRGGWEAKWSDDAKRTLAFVPQSTAAGIIKEAMLALWDETPFGRMLRLQVHDSLLCAPRAEEFEEALATLVEVMERPVRVLRLPWQPDTCLSIDVEVKVGQLGESWGALKEVSVQKAVAA